MIPKKDIARFVADEIYEAIMTRTWISAMSILNEDHFEWIDLINSYPKE